MGTLNITGTVTDSSGATYIFSTTATSTVADNLTATAAVTPASAPAGTTRNLTVTATSSAGDAITYSTPVAAGITFTQVSGKPNQWTFVY